MFRVLTVEPSLQRTFYFSPSTLHPHHTESLPRIHVQVLPHDTGCSPPGLVKVLGRCDCRRSPALSAMPDAQAELKKSSFVFKKKKKIEIKLLLTW